MRVAIIVVSMFVMATPSQASKSCMTKTEAREHFGSAHLYWHGPDHCWDGMAGRHRLVHGIQRKTERQVRHEDQRPKWRQAMSELMADDTATQSREAQPSVRYDAVNTADVRDTANVRNVRDTADARDAGSDWHERWVDVVQVVPPNIGRKPEQVAAAPAIERQVEPMVSPGSVILVFLGLTLTVVTVEILFRSTIYERRS
jgi:hypothetical protein